MKPWSTNSRCRRREIGRRAFLRRYLVAPAAIATLGTTYCVAVEPTWVAVTRLKMPLRGLASAFEGYRLVHISDLHCGSSVPMGYLAGCMERVNELEPDLVVVTGDLVTRGERLCADQAAAILSRLRPPDGLAAILGNHDHGQAQPGPGDPRWAARVTQAVSTRGHLVLRNQSIRVTKSQAGLRIVGLGDLWARAFDLPKAFEEVDGVDPVIALSHNPDTFMHLSRTQAQWTLAGHTHGGQVDLPLLGPPLLPLRDKTLASGQFERENHHLYVNRGLGWLRRVRFNARPEITLFELTQA